ncbi:MAG: SDR family NAD(P)-dependent oxidoreductase [Planctomycetota bacterium]|nr:MAG: SDR family NAD(P)-dependent oxidoreductase [Planctomycetota bacterium]
MLEGKKGVILGVANAHSLAWHIAKSVHRDGGQMRLGVANERFRSKAHRLAERLHAGEPVVCDVTSDESIQTAFERFAEDLGELDFVVHAVAFARKEDLEGRFMDTTRSGYHLAQDISAYSLAAVCKAAEPYLKEGSSILTLSYIGSVRAMPSYNVMGVAKAALESSVRYLAVDLGAKGIRVNALSAGPIKTLSSSAIKGLKEKLDLQEKATPLKRRLTGEEVGNAAAFLLSDLASAVTGEVLYVDNGYHIIGSLG